jgi:Zn-dependent peptidase ImmA (M78 family)/transcriptional regulator with XRE-family HTH domain
MAFGEMLRLARQRRRIRQNEAATKLGVSPTDLSRLENDAKEPTTAFIDKAADAFGVPTNFFERTDRIYGAPVSVHPMWRKKGDVTGIELDAVIAELNVRVMHLRTLLQATDIKPIRTLPELDIEEWQDPDRIAGVLRAHWMIPKGPILNLTEIVEEAGIVVAHSNMGGSSISGVTFRVPGVPPLIVLNSEQPADRMRHTLAHELAHVIMHRFPTATMEKEADEFASCFLAPTMDIKHQWGGGRVDLARLASLKREWHMSMASLVFVADRCGKLTTAQKNYLWQQFAMKKIRMSEPPELDFPREQPTILSNLLRLHIDNLGYKLADLGRILAMTTEELPKFYDLTNALEKRTPPSRGLRIVR